MPAVLDVACGTGRALDLGLTTPDRYAGVDPSAPMLNQLVRKHPTVARVYPTTIESALADGLFSPRQFEIVTLMVDGADAFADATVAAIAELASRAFIHVRGDSVAVHRT
jgi:SAM-dependent methyltransferase